MQFRWKVFTASLRSRSRSDEKLRWVFEDVPLAPAKKLIAIPDRVPGNRRNRNSPAQFPKYPASNPLHAGTSGRFARAGNVQENHHDVKSFQLARKNAIVSLLD